VGDPTPGLVPVNSDAAVLERVRRGDVRAYGVLYQRYVEAARGVARSLLRNATDADDVVSEVFASILSVILRGKGPREAFVAYLMVSVRNECQRTLRRRGRDCLLAESTEALLLAEVGLEQDPFARHDETEVLQKALRSLPPRFREVLWRTEVAGQSNEEIAEVIGSTAQAVAAQATRARRALGGAYLRTHLDAASRGQPPASACAETRRHLADFVRGSIRARARRRLEHHLSGCPSCRHACAELERVNERLRAGPALPLAVWAGVLRVGLRARILGWLASSTAPLVAASGLVVVSTIVPLDVAQPLGGDDRLAEAAAPQVEPDDGALPDGGTRSSEAAGAPYATASSGWRSIARDDVATTASTSTRRSMTGTRVHRRDEGASTPPTRPSDAPAPANTRPAAPPPNSFPPPASTPDAELPAITVPSSVAPPEVVIPDEDVPAITTPPVSLPPTSVPQTTVAAATVAAVIVPAVTVPAKTGPQATLPAVTVPPVAARPSTVPLIGG
jgi:RNA polymerase sigma factor (sigma-70 family)